jgi:hypothetical protein
MRSAILVMLLASPLLAKDAVLVTTCGQTVHGVAQLNGNLDCSGSADEGIRLSGRLFLNGFTMTGHPAHNVVECASSCVIVGPGTITGGSDGVRGDRRVKVVDSTSRLNTGDGIHADGSASVSGTTVSDNAGDGIRSNGSARVMSSVVSGNDGAGIQADHSLTVRSSSVTANGDEGVAAGSTVRLRETSVTGNGLDGAHGRRITLTDATATGNGTSATCGVTDECADLASPVSPRVTGTSTCGTSRKTESSGTWGVCTND